MIFSSNLLFIHKISVAKFCGPVSGWTYSPETNRCFRVFTSLSTYLSAGETCRQIGGRLAVPDSEATFNIFKNIAVASSTTVNFYMALWKPGSSWKIYDGVNEFDPPYTNYDLLQPTSLLGENCAVFQGFNGKWKAVACSDMNGFVCEKEIYGHKSNRYFARTASRNYIVPKKQQLSCPKGWVLSQGTATCYKMFRQTPMTWQNADNFCLNNHGAKLATVRTTEDQTVVWNQLLNNANFTVDTPLWIGYAQLASNQWVWGDGSDPSVGAAKWDSGQPTLVGSGYAYYPANTNFWRSGTGSELYGFVCSKQAYGDWKTWGGKCPNNYVEFDGNCYRYVASSVSRDSAKSDCKTQGGDLVEMSNIEQVRFVASLLPVTVDSAWTDIAYTGGKVQYGDSARSPDLRDIEYLGQFADETDINATSGCGYVNRGDKFLVRLGSCSDTRPYICQQPAAYCPPSWVPWAGSCYRKFNTAAHIQPNTNFDTAQAFCQYEGALPVSPVDTNEFAFVKSLAGVGQSFVLGYRRGATSYGYTDMSGRPSYFAGTLGEPTSGYYFSYWNGAIVSFTSDSPVTTVMCSTPSKLDVEECLRECLATSEFDCSSVVYDGEKCKFTKAHAADDWFGLRESYGLTDLYTIRKDICHRDLVKEAMTASTTADLDVPFAISNLTANGYSPVDPSDVLQIEFAGSTWLNSLVLSKIRPGDSQFLESFTLSYSFDRDIWYTFQDPAGTDKVFLANDNDTDTQLIKLPRAILIKIIRIVPVSYQANPAYRISLGGCDASIFSDYAEYKYDLGGSYIVAVEAYSPASNSSSTPIEINVQSRLLSVTVPDIPPLPLGNWADVEIKYTHSSTGSYPTANATFNGKEIDNITIAYAWKTANALIGPSYYSGIGEFPINVTLDNLLVDPIHIKRSLNVDFAIEDLTVTTNASETHGALYNQTVEVYVTMNNCSRCNISIDFGAIDAVPSSWFGTFDYIAAYVPIPGVPSVMYPQLSPTPYVIKVTANNFLPYKMTATYDIYIQLNPVPTAFNYSSTQVNKITTDGPAEVTFYYHYTGYVSEFPSFPNMFLDFDDGTNYTQSFNSEPYFLPAPSPMNPEPSVTYYLMGDQTHSYATAGEYEVVMDVFNRVGRIGQTVKFFVEEDIVGLKIVPRERYIIVGVEQTYDIEWTLGTNFNWQVRIPMESGPDQWTEVFNSTVRNFTWTFYEPGTYFLAINASNRVQPDYPAKSLDNCCPIVVQYPVKPDHYRLTVTPQTGKLIFASAEDEIGSVITQFQLWYNPMSTPQPTTPSMIVDYDDNLGSVNETLVCDTALADITDGPWVLCKNLPYTYTDATTFNVKANIFNLASSENFETFFTVFVSVTNLRMGVQYTENETHPVWEDGFPRINPVFGPKPYSLSFFPSGKSLRIVANAKLGSGLRYCFFSSVEGNITDCSNVPTNQATPNFVIRKFPYDTPCGGRLERCGLTLYVVAANPVDSATASINVYLQKPTIAPRVIEFGPAVENVIIFFS